MSETTQFIPKEAINENNSILRNFPIKLINPHTNKEVAVWKARSSATNIFAFVPDFQRKWYNPLSWVKKQKWYVLTTQRGEGCPDYVGYYSCPGGYIDWNETFNDAARRELHEETGLFINEPIKIHKVNSNVTSNLQNLSVVFYCILKKDKEYYENLFSYNNMENKEISDIKFIDVDLCSLKNYNWAFPNSVYSYGHMSVIIEIYNEYINTSWFYKHIIDPLFYRKHKQFVKQLNEND